MIKIAITKGRIEKDVCKLFKEAGFDTKSIETKNRELKIKTNDDIEMVFVKASDVLNFIRGGIIDIGIVGKDTLDESSSSDYNELLDLKIGKCYFVLAGFPEYKNCNFSNKKRIATKYPNITTKYFNMQNEDIEIIKMEGSVELGPVVGLADAIVDIVETGDTLKANGLVILDKISDISTRLIVNKDSEVNKNDEIEQFVERLNNQINKNENKKININ